MPRVLILGSSGLLGSGISRILNSSFDVVGTHFNNAGYSIKESIRLDISKPEILESIIKDVSPDYVINCVGSTSVEECERLPEKAMLLNAVFPQRIASASNLLGFRYIHVSTDHYGTLSHETRNESMNPILLNQYAYSKYIGERLVLNENPESLILRTNFFGISASGNHSILDFAIKSLTKSIPIFGYEDVWFTPLGITQVGNFLATTLDRELTGILNLSGNESITKLTFLREVALGLGLDPNLVVAAKSSELSSRVTRPSNLSLDNSRLRSLGIQLPGLKDMIQEELSDRVVA
jgi:dTDP-4-dehydrorhamnose reductase